MIKLIIHNIILVVQPSGMAMGHQAEKGIRYLGTTFESMSNWVLGT